MIKRWHKSKAGRDSAKRSNMSPSSRASRKKYNQSLKGRIAKKKHNDSLVTRMQIKKYQNSPKGRATAKKYHSSPTGKAMHKRFNDSVKAKFSHYKHGAEKRFLCFKISFKQFQLFWQKPCYYGGCPIETVGLDRIDSKIGYTIRNIVPCCWIHNRMKGGLTREIFIEYCKRITIFHAVKGAANVD